MMSHTMWRQQTAGMILRFHCVRCRTSSEAPAGPWTRGAPCMRPSKEHVLWGTQLRVRQWLEDIACVAWWYVVVLFFELPQLKKGNGCGFWCQPCSIPRRFSMSFLEWETAIRFVSPFTKVDKHWMTVEPIILLSGRAFFFRFQFWKALGKYSFTQSLPECWRMKCGKTKLPPKGRSWSLKPRDHWAMLNPHPNPSTMFNIVWYVWRLVVRHCKGSGQFQSASKGRVMSE